MADREIPLENLNGINYFPATQFVVDKASRKIIEADSNFQNVTGYKAGNGRNAVFLDSLLTDEYQPRAAEIIAGKIKRGTVSAIKCRFRLKEAGIMPGILLFQPYALTGITSRIVCILILCGIAEDSKNEPVTERKEIVRPSETVQSTETAVKNEAPKTKETAEVKKADDKKEAANEKKPEYELKTIDDLKNAIENEEFEVFIHPIYSMNTGLAVGGEILTHWVKSGNPAGGFFPQFDEEELCSELDFYILTRSLQALSRSDKADILKLSFNLSNQIFQAFGFVERLTDLVEAFDIKTANVMLEIKEELLVSGMYNIIEQIGNLRENGFKVVIDNVSGDGKLLPLLSGRRVDMIKLSHDIIMRGLNAESGKDLFRQIIETALFNNVEIICTRIETESQYSTAKRAGCVMGQGYMLSRPKAFADFISE